jgi:hypothetical protein
MVGEWESGSRARGREKKKLGGKRVARGEKSEGTGLQSGEELGTGKVSPRGEDQQGGVGVGVDAARKDYGAAVSRREDNDDHF